MALNYSLSAADVFFTTSLYQEDWDMFTETEKQAGLNSAVKCIQQNSNKTIDSVYSDLSVDETIYNFNNFIFVQALYMLKNADRYRTSTGPMAIMLLSEDKATEKTYKQAIPTTFLYPESLAEIGIIPQGLVSGRG